MKYTPLFILLFILFSCGGEQAGQADDVTSAVNSDLTNERVEKAKKIFYTIPSPYETAIIFEGSGISYNVSLLNPVNNVVKYTTKSKQALNFGVYGADLSYANMFDQSQQCMFYMNSAKKLGDQIGVTAAFDVETLERIERNLNNRDSLMFIINDSYWIADAQLKENQQDYLSALIIAGGWIEGLYLGSASLQKNKSNEAIMKIVAEQKYSIENLIGLMDLYEQEDVLNIKRQLATLKLSFDKITETNQESNVSHIKEMAVVGGGSTLQYTPELIFEIAKNVKIIRDEITK